MSHIMTKESELRLHWAELQELEQKVVELIATALKLAPGLERRDEPRSDWQLSNANCRHETG